MLTELDFELFEITRHLGFLFPLLIAACGIVAAVKLPGVAARILAGLGFGALLLQPLAVTITRFIEPDEYFALYDIVPGPIFTFIALFGWALILTGLFFVRGRAPAPAEAAGPALQAAAPDPGWGAPAPADAAAPPPPPAGAYAPPSPSTVSTASPGWGLASAYAVLSAVSFLSAVLLLAVVIDAGSRINDDEMVAIVVGICVSLLISIPAAVLYLIWLYKTWDAVPEAYRSATPGTAVGFLFIPFFNYYWVFRAVPGLSASIRRAREANNPHAAGSAGFGVGVTACILALIPYVGVISGPFFLIWVLLANAEKNRMLEDFRYRSDVADPTVS